MYQKKGLKKIEGKKIVLSVRPANQIQNSHFLSTKVHNARAEVGLVLDVVLYLHVFVFEKSAWLLLNCKIKGVEIFYFSKQRKKTVFLLFYFIGSFPRTQAILFSK